MARKLCGNLVPCRVRQLGPELERMLERCVVIDSRAGMKTGDRTGN